jgi:hypothetical protein
MTKGILIFAHNSRELDYGLMAMISGNLASKYLNLPVSLATDKSTINWLKESGNYSRAGMIFDEIIRIDNPASGNKRKIYDGNSFKIVPFENYSRADAWYITPYDHTLLIDSDFLIFTDNLNHYWDLDSSFMMASGINDIFKQERLGYHDRYVSDTGVHMFWATTVMFKKDKAALTHFELIDYVRKNYRYYSDLFRFDGRQYRNDRSFTVAKHILDGFETNFNYSLPPLTTVLDRDILYSVSKNQRLYFLINQNQNSEQYFPLSVKNIDLHVMNKQSIIRNSERLLDFI